VATRRWPCPTPAQRAQLLLADPRSEDLAGRVAVDQVVPHLGELLVRQAFSAAQQPPAGGPRGVGLAAPAAMGVPGDPPPKVGDCLIGQADEVEVVGHYSGVR
jgi:hypothetical protein